MTSSSQSQLRVEQIPQALSWINPPKNVSYGSGNLRILAGEKTDLFIDPQRKYMARNSPQATFLPDSTFMLSCKVRVGFKWDYDAGVLVLHASNDKWAKLCFEYSPQKKPTVVSVVNNVISDDCNHTTINGPEVYLRISGLGQNIFAFHYSTDGAYWHLARYFHIDSADPVRVGFSSQSPTGEFCESLFSEIAYSNRRLEELRNGK